jgi:hypothetical protein
MDTDQIITAAEALGIKMTAAHWGTELCQCWADRVALAQSYFERGETAKCQEMIGEANRYAI